MRFDEPPSEETLRILIDEARGRGEETVTVEATSESGDAWVRAGFSEQARVLEASVASLEQRLSSHKGPSYGSVHVQTDDLDGVVRAVRQFVPRLPGGSKGSVVAPPRNGWIGVYDELTDRNPEMLRRLARELSDRMGAVVLQLGVEEGQVVRFVLLERGRTMDEYLSVPEYYGEVAPGDVISLAANPTVVARLTGANAGEVRRVIVTGRSPDELPPAEELVAAVGSLLGVEGGDHGYKRAGEIPDAVDIPRE
ncbi:MAG TPA: hypothetical protein VK273_03475 [Gaiellaceae bacterium]|nr:hypothetical protein [Gaiellaceae bacterium]